MNSQSVGTKVSGYLITPSSSTPRDSLVATSSAYVGDTVSSLSADRKAAFIQLTFLNLRPFSAMVGLSAGSVSSYTCHSTEHAQYKPAMPVSGHLAYALYALPSSECAAQLLCSISSDGTRCAERQRHPAATEVDTAAEV